MADNGKKKRMAFVGKIPVGKIVGRSLLALVKLGALGYLVYWPVIHINHYANVYWNSLSLATSPESSGVTLNVLGAGVALAGLGLLGGFVTYLLIVVFIFGLFKPAFK